MEKAKELLREQAVTLSKSGDEVHILCSSCEDAELIFEWLESMAVPKMSKEYCAGCENNEYNHGLGGAKGCWCFESAKLTMRKEVHIDQKPPWEQNPRLLPSCYRRRRFVYVDPDVTC